MSEPALPTKKKRRWQSFSLRTTLILIAIASGALAWVDHRARKQMVALEWIQKYDGHPIYDFQYNNGKFGKNSPPGPAWLHDMIGIDYFATVEMVHLDNRPIDDISLIVNLPRLRHFELSEGGGLSDIRPLAHLRWLEHLSLSHNPISDISALSNLTELKRLFLFDTKISDISALGAGTKIEYLWISQTEISDLTPLMKHSRLATLNVARTNVSDLSPLVRLVSLSDLNIRDTAVTDITPLYGLVALKSLDLSQNAIPDSEIDKLQEQLPNCTIKR